METEGYEMKVGDIVYFKCEVIEILSNCQIVVKGRNVADQYVKIVSHVNSFIKKEKPDDEMCEKCGKNPAQEEHSCPYKEDINDDYETMCTCCEDCEDNCRDEI